MAIRLSCLNPHRSLRETRRIIVGSIQISVRSNRTTQRSERPALSPTFFREHGSRLDVAVRHDQGSGDGGGGLMTHGAVIARASIKVERLVVPGQS